MEQFTHLHVHSDYSFLDGAASIKSLVKSAKKYKMEALALTDHGNMTGVIEFYLECKHNKIKPIIGIETYIAPSGIGVKEKKRYHLTLLAYNNKGYKNLIKLSSIAYLEGMYYKPRVDIELLDKYSEGLIALGACINGEIPRLILEEEMEKAKEKAGIYNEIFKNNFYLELMRIGLPENEIVNKGEIEISKALNIGLVATNDVHFIDKEDHLAHEAHLCINTRKTFLEENRMRSPEQIYFRSTKEMYELFKDIPESLKNTNKIAEMCNVEIHIDPQKPFLPKVKIPENYENIEKYLEDLVWEGAQEKYGENLDEKVKKRIKREISVIDKTGFAGYFLIIRDIVQAAIKRKIRIGPGRGSVVGSVVLYCLGITAIEPLRYNLLFERFLNPERINPPDIDLDFSDDKRDIIIKYMIEKFGNDAVSYIGTTGNLKTRQVIRDVAKVLGLQPAEVDKLSKYISDRNKKPKGEEGSVVKWLYTKNINHFKDAVDKDNRLTKFIEIASKLEGLKRHPGIHAAGVLIAPGNITDYIPLRKDKNKKIISQFDMDSITNVGLIKVDILGLTTLTIIDKTIELIKENKKKDIIISEIPLTDKKVFSLLSRGETVGAFQLESSGMKDLCTRIKPSSIDDIIAIVSLYRPGPMEHIDTFINRKQGKEKVKYLHPLLEPILKETYGIPIYQEQVMQIPSVLAGYSLGKADILRRAMGKKKIKVMEDEKVNFFEGSKKNGISKEISEKIWNMIEPFAGYGFNKSHGAGYAYLAYYTAYLKAHYPIEFITACLHSEVSDTKKTLKYFQEARRLKINILPPSINSSSLNFKIERKKNIRYGLGAIKNVGEIDSEKILIERKKGKFKNYYDFLERVELNKRSLEFLAMAGVFDEFVKNRATLIKSVEIDKKKAKQKKKEGESEQLTLFNTVEIEDNFEYEEKEHTWTLQEKLDAEEEALGFQFTQDPFSEYTDHIIFKGLNSISKIRRGYEDQCCFLCLINNIEEKDNKYFFETEDKNDRIKVIIEKKKSKFDFKTTKRKKNNKALGIGSIIIVYGNRKKKNDNIIIEAEEIFTKENLFQIKGTIFEINLTTDFMKEKSILKIKNILLKFKGDIPVKICFLSKDKDNIRLSSNISINYNDELLNDLNDFLIGKRFYFKVDLNKRKEVN